MLNKTAPSKATLRKTEVISNALLFYGNEEVVANAKAAISAKEANRVVYNFSKVYGSDVIGTQVIDQGERVEFVTKGVIPDDKAIERLSRLNPGITILHRWRRKGGAWNESEWRDGRSLGKRITRPKPLF